MRVLIVTGKGGVGKTTVAAGTAVVSARQGRKTLALSTDGAHSLADALDLRVAPGSDPVEIEPGLFVSQVDARRRFERSWQEIQEYLLAILHSTGMDPIAAEELTLLPGAEEVFALLEMRDHVRSDRYDLVVVDCAPTAETLRLLALPEALRWYMDRVCRVERRVVRALRPMLGRAAGVPMPEDRVFHAVERLHADLTDVRDILTDPGTSVRLVLTPEAVVVAEARRTLTSLALYGYVVDGVVANRIFPEDGGDAWRASWVRAQAARLAEVDASFAPIPVRRAPFRAAEPVGADALAELAGQVYGCDDPAAPADPADMMSVESDDPDFVLSLRLPLAERRDLQLARAGDELIVTVGAHRRVLALPSALRRCVIKGAALADGRLRVRLTPDPAQWRPL